MSNLLYSVEEIFSDTESGYLKRNGKKHYHIPVYQRGYKWSKSQVRKLLNDICKFESDGEKFYCLQNITVVPNKTDSVFNVVDGQQRLTTLVVLLSFLGKQSLVKGKVCFPEESIRTQTNRFINDIITSNLGLIDGLSWEEFINASEDFDHQDIYYLYSCYQTIKEWFHEQRIKPDDFLPNLLVNVRLIVNNISDDSKEEKIFGNLNSKRIPLDGADLARAILITRVANEEGKRAGDVKNIVRVNERRIRIGWELDEMNNWWAQPDVKDYFKRFHTIESEEVSPGNKLFRVDRFPINRLLLLFAEREGKTELTLDVIEERNNDALGLYHDLVQLHTTLVDWFADREIYHYLGYLFAQRMIRFSDVWKLWTVQSGTRQDFCASLKKRIHSNVYREDTSNGLKEDVNWYEENQEQLVRVLILLDIVWSIRMGQSFLPPSAFTRAGYDIEHIFPQNPQEVKDKKSYIQFLNAYVLNKPQKALEKLFDTQLEDPDFLQRVEAFIAKHTAGIKIHSIGNLVLLDASKNRSLKNNPYSFKRASLIRDINKGIHIRPHTLKVFVRHFETGQQESHDGYLWTNKDIDANASAISIVLKEFFSK
jgi:hypothetical protein